MTKFVANPTDADGYSWPSMTVIGVDPSMTATGWAVVHFRPYVRPTVMAHGTIRTESTGEQNMRDNVLRSGMIFSGMQDVVAAYGETLDEVSIELPVPGSFGVGSQSGSMMVVAVHSALLDLGLPVGLHAPNHTKKVVALDGRAEKKDVKAMVFAWLGREFKTNTDVTDAVSAALCHVIDKGGLG